MPLSLDFGEAELIWHYFAQHPRVGTMIDVGAQFGTSFRAYLETGWRVVAFEPEPGKVTKLQKYLGNPRLTFYPQAVGDREMSNVAFFTSEESTGISSLIPFRASHKEAARVNVTTLAKVIPELDLKQLDYLKIDTEGNDYRVLTGFPWATLTPDVLMCEFDELKTRGLGFDYRSTGDLLTSKGYEVWISEWHPLLRYGSGHRWRSIEPYPSNVSEPDAWGNFIAVHKDSHPDTMRSLVATYGGP